MKVTIEIQCDNAAFGEDEYGQSVEVARILDALVDDLTQVSAVPAMKKLYDINGNKVGQMVVAQ